MKNHFLFAALLVLSALLFPSQAQDQPAASAVINTPNPSGAWVDDVASRKRRVAELETQNHAMLQLLQTINDKLAKLESRTEIATTPIAAVMTAKPEPTPAPPPPRQAGATPAATAAAESVRWNEVTKAFGSVATNAIPCF